MSILTKSDIVKLFEDYLKNYKSTINTTDGTLIKDVIVNATAEELSVAFTELIDVQEGQTIQNATTISNDEVDSIAYNWNLTRKPAVKASGHITFISLTQPTTTIRIGNISGNGGIIVRTGQVADGNSISFVTTETVYLTSTTPYDASVAGYAVTAAIEALEGGGIGNIGSNTITVLQRPITGVTTITNQNIITGGAEEETNASLIKRIIYAVKGINVGSIDGIRTVALGVAGVSDVTVVTSNDTESVRGTNGGVVDVVVYGSGSGTYIESFTYKGTETTFNFSRKPVTAISTITGTKNNVTKIAVENIDYIFNHDTTSIYARSTQANDYITWKTLDIFDVGTNVTITYQYDKLVWDVQETLQLNANKLVVADILTKSAQEVLIDIAITVTKNTGYTHSITENEVELAIINHINNLGLGDTVEVSDIVFVVKELASVNTITVPFTILRRRGTTTAPARILATKFEYFRVDNASISVTVN